MYRENRRVMKAGNWVNDGNRTSDQKRGVEEPSKLKDFNLNHIIFLKSFDKLNLEEKSISSTIVNRRSRRKFTGESINLEQLSYLLYLNCGITFEQNDRSYRAYPSGGNRQCFETYIYVQNVDNLERGLYRYIPSKHGLLLIRRDESIISDKLCNQLWADRGAVTFFWTVIPYRGEWRYMERAYKTMLLDAGHLCQNLYLACEGIGLGTCAIGAYEQEKIDEFLEVDGEEEFVVYISPVGKYNNLAYKFDEDFREVPVNRDEMEAEVTNMIFKFKETNNFRLSSKIGVYLRILGRVEEGLEYIKLAHEQNKKEDISYIVDSIRLISCYQWLGNFDKCELILKELGNMELHNYEDFFLQHRGKVLFDQGKYLEARESFLSALSIRKKKGDDELIQSTLGILNRTEEILG